MGNNNLNDQTLPVSPTPQPPPPVSKPKPKFSLAVIIGTVLLLLIAGSAAGFYAFKPQILKLVSKPSPTPTVIPSLTRNPISPTPDPTVNWKIYTNNDYHFSFRYPPEFTLKNVDKQVINSADFDGQKVSLTHYILFFTTGKLVRPNDPTISPTQDISGLRINVTSTNGKTIMQNYDNKGAFENNARTKVTLLHNFGAADEVADVSYAQNHIRTYRKGAYFFDLAHPQEGKVFPYGIDDINTYTDQILATFKFTNSNTTPTPTCMSRPACLDATPRCMIAEPASGWCPR